MTVLGSLCRIYRHTDNEHVCQYQLKPSLQTVCMSESHNERMYVWKNVRAMLDRTAEQRNEYEYE